jgi:uncharacterized membrane protein
MADDTAKKTVEVDKKDIEENKTMAIVAYLGLIGVIVVLATGAHTKSPYVKFHLNQSLPLMIASLLSAIPFLGWIVGLVVLVLWVMGIIAAAQGEMKRLPITGNFELIK